MHIMAEVMVLYVVVNVLQGIFTGIRSLSTELVMRKIACAVRFKLFRAIVKMDVPHRCATALSLLAALLHNCFWTRSASSRLVIERALMLFGAFPHGRVCYAMILQLDT